MSDIHLIYTHASGGSLSQGGYRAVEELISQPTGINVLVLAATEYQPRPIGSPDGKLENILSVSLSDFIFPVGSEDWKQHYKAAKDASKTMAAYVKSGKRVLSTCMGGFNRSGLLSGFTLVRLGLSPEKAIELIRTARGVEDGLTALFNTTFTSMVVAFGREVEQR